MTGRMERLGEAVSILRRNANVVDAAYKEAGIRFKTDASHTSRIDLLARLLRYVKDERMDIDDRIEQMDDTITLVGVPWGRGQTNFAWTRIYGCWQTMMQMWKLYESQRYREVTYMAEISESMAAVLVAGQEAEKEKPVWSEPKLVHLKTYVAMKLLDQQEGRDTVKLLNMVELKAPQEGRRSPLMEEDQEHKVKVFGEVEMIPRGFKVLNFAFHEIDVTTQSVMVFHLTAQNQEEQGGSIVPTSKLRRPQHQNAAGMQS